MASKIAVQLYTLRDHTKTAKDFATTLEKVHRIGYEAVQLSAVGAMDGAKPEVDAAEARKMLDANGLHCAATHRDWGSLANNTDFEIAFHQTLGCNFTAIGGLPREYNSRGVDGYRQFLRDSAPVIANLKAGGLRFGYHNHAQEFQRIGVKPRTLWDLFLEEGSKDFLMEIDVYWAAHAGINPARLFERCRRRVPVIHAKDKEVFAKEGPVMAPVGEGNLDWGSILPACKRAGVEWYAVEQDTCYRDPFDCLRSSYRFLREQGL